MKILKEIGIFLINTVGKIAIIITILAFVQLGLEQIGIGEFRVGFYSGFAAVYLIRMTKNLNIIENEKES